MKAVKNFVIGIILGLSNVIPGVSAGTMAVVFKVYDKILAAVSLKNLKRNILFLLPIVLGVALGIVVFARPISYLFDAHLTLTSWFFIGVIVGSLPMLVGRVREGSGSWIAGAIAFVIPLAFMLWLGFASGGAGVNHTIADITLTNALILVACGAISAFAMVVPGVSGSMILLALGYYQSVMQAIKSFNIPLLALFGVGCLIGGLGAVFAMKQFLKRFHRQAYCAIIGLIVGSLYSMYQPLPDVKTAIFAILLALAGAACSFGFDMLDRKLSSTPDGASSGDA